MKNFPVHAVRVLIGCAIGFLGLSASAAPIWDFNSGCAQNSSSKNNYGNSFDCTAGAASPALTATAWSTTGSAGTTFQTANIALYSGAGFGVRNRAETLEASAPQHSMDGNGNTDVVVLAFSDEVVLSALTLGWTKTDSDVSVLRYTGADAPAINGQSILGLLSGGWELVGSYANLTTGTAKGINPLGLYSNWWMISAYSSSYGVTGTGLNNGNDYVKLSSVSGTTAPPPPPKHVPEPGTAALLVAAAGGLFATRRRRKV